MSMDLDDRAHRAGAGLRALASERAASMRPPGTTVARPRRRATVLVAAAAAVVALVVGTVLVTDVGPTLQIDPVSPTTPDTPSEQPPGPVADAEGWLPVPEVGAVTAAYRSDLTPVFVTHPADGEVFVLDPVDPHRPFELDTLVAFCPSSGWFEDLYHGSRFNAWGDWTGGPAPAGLAAYPVELDDDGTRIRITSDLEPNPARDEPRGPDQGPVGPGCAVDRDQPADIVGHRPPPAVPTLHGDEVTGRRWVWATLVLGGEPDDIRVCAPDGSCPPDAPPVTFAVGRPGTQLERTPVTYLVRLEDDGRVRVLHPADPTDGGYLQLTVRDQALLSVPAPGSAAAVTLRDNTPVFAITTDAGDIHLLAAWSPDDPARLLGWCPSDQRLHGASTRYAPDGRNLDVSGQDLPAYDIAIDDVGDDQGIRITRRPAETDDDAAPSTELGSTPTCSGDLVVHQPTSDEPVFDSPDGIQLNGERWAWVRMSVQQRDGERYLCSLADAVPGCGVPHPEHTNCLGAEVDRPAACPPLQDPVVTTPNIDPHDERRLLLVRASDDGTTARVRIPHHMP